MERLARYPNFHVDTASTQNPGWALRAAVQILGAERVLWGTDAPGIDFAQRLGVILASRLSEAEVRQVLGLNAARLLGLEGRWARAATPASTPSGATAARSRSAP
jgi:predicted TIM-barrel fold metal-dependent hydrolase